MERSGHLGCLGQGTAELLLLHSKEVGTLGTQDPLASLGKPQPPTLSLRCDYTLQRQLLLKAPCSLTPVLALGSTMHLEETPTDRPWSNNKRGRAAHLHAGPKAGLERWSTRRLVWRP